jgi:S1-C subfamily serine protease
VPLSDEPTQKPAAATTPAHAAVAPVASPKQEIAAQQSQAAATGTPIASRVENPYPTPPLDFADINTATRAALVNIFCTPHGGSLHPISGSGIIIDSRGVILTNAHVAQYVLLSESQNVNLSCVVRAGSPASARFVPDVLYIPPVWVSEHAADINATHPVGTGEHDYALLAITATTDGSPLPSSFPAVNSDTREGIAFVDDPVLAASYPAEFTGGSVQMNLYPVSTITQIAKLYTFRSGSIDVISVGGVIEAQGGSSGGAVVNAWGRLVGLITTTSEGATTAERELRAVTTSYIERDLTAQTGTGFSVMLSGNLIAKTGDFTKNQTPSLIEEYLPYLSP